MLMCAKQMKAEGRLKGNAIVATVMSNIGLELALKEAGIGMVRCAVGDKYVMEEMMRRDLSLGGEQSGHIIFSEYLFTGDGLATALNVLRTMSAARRELARSGIGVDDVSAGAVEPACAAEGGSEDRCRRLPSVIASVESRLAGNGRLLVRYSGTEPLLRVMLEGQDPGDDPAVGAGDHRCRETPSSVRRSRAMVRLSVNVNKVATLRNSRGGAVPSVLDAVRVCVDAGAPGITVHPQGRCASHHVDRRASKWPRCCVTLEWPRRVQHRRRPATAICSRSCAR